MSTTLRLRSVLKWTAALAVLLFVGAMASFFVLSADANPLTSNPLPLFALLGVFIVSWLGVVGLDFYIGMQQTESHTDSQRAAEPTEQGAPAEPRNPAEVYLARFRRLNLYVGGLLAAFVGTVFVLDSLAGSSGTAQVVAVAHGIVSLAITMIGGLGNLVLVTLLFLGVWYGLRQEATEALIAGIGVWGLVGLVGLSSVAATTSGIGLVIASAYGVYYGIRAHGSTEPRILTGGTPAEH